MQAPEDDLKRRARRRLIGAVALTLTAVIVLPLLLEDEPPPAGRLEVAMPPQEEIAPAPVAPAPPVVAEATVPDSTTVPNPPEVLPTQPVVPKKPAPKPNTPPGSLSKSSPVHAADATAFVVQLGAFSDTEKVSALKTRVSKLGLASYTDKSGLLTRVRVGPFSSREAATAAAVKLAAEGLGGQVMPK